MNSPDTTVLVVDDHALVRDMLAARLNAETGLSVVGSAADAATACALARERAPDVVLMDVDMPGYSPFAAAADIKSALPGTRVLFVSGYLNDTYIGQALEAEAVGYVSKAEPVEAIVEAVHAAARGLVYFSPAVVRRIVIDAAGASLASSTPTRMQLLTPRERQVLVHLARGFAKKEIARMVGISAKTVDRHATHIMDKLDIHDRVELARFAIREGLVEP